LRDSGAGTIIATDLVIDHLWLVSKRDALKNATDAATVATTLALKRAPLTATDDVLGPALQVVADRYVWLNLSSNRPDLERGDVAVTVAFNRAAGTLGVRTEARLGGGLFDSLLPSGVDWMAAESGAEQGSDPLSVVLALDTSRSMGLDLAGNQSQDPSRMSIVREAAADLVDIIGPSASVPVLVGLVPWDRTVGTVLALSTHEGAIRAAIADLQPLGDATFSTAGIERASAMLQTRPEIERKVIVLLTDGEDNLDHNGFCGSPEACARVREMACEIAKYDGREIFVVAALNAEHTALADGLRACASEPKERHVFVNNATPEALAAAFEAIAREVKPLRLTR